MENFRKISRNTPLYPFKWLKKHLQIEGNLFGKLEGFNLSGSIKVRTVASILESLQKRGLSQGAEIVEATSGNTGVALCQLAPTIGCKPVLFMTDEAFERKRELFRSLSATCMLSPTELGMKGARAHMHTYLSEHPSAVPLEQFSSPYGPLGQKEVGEEILAELPNVNCICAGVGTGGTVMGIAKAIEKSPQTKLYAVEPASAPNLSGGKIAPHKLYGLGAGFYPSLFNPSACSGIWQVQDEEAEEMVKLALRCEGILLGNSSGASLVCAVRYLRQHPGHVAVAICPDFGR